MLNWIKYFLVLSILSGSYVYAEEITIDSIESLEGASLQCFKDKEKGLTLGIYSESGREVISVFPKGKYLYLSHQDINYSTVLGADDMIDSLELIRNAYIYNSNPVSGPAISSDELNKTQESYNQLKDALSEAHEKGKCLNWKL